MDDQLELPSAHIATNEQEREDDAAGSSDEEDGGPDWTNLPWVLSRRWARTSHHGLIGRARLHCYALCYPREAKRRTSQPMEERRGCKAMYWAVRVRPCSAP
jgi:hypothetical protein